MGKRLCGGNSLPPLDTAVHLVLGLCNSPACPPNGLRHKPMEPEQVISILCTEYGVQSYLLATIFPFFQPSRGVIYFWLSNRGSLSCWTPPKSGPIVPWPNCTEDAGLGTLPEQKPRSFVFMAEHVLAWCRVWDYSLNYHM